MFRGPLLLSVFCSVFSSFNFAADIESVVVSASPLSSSKSEIPIALSKLAQEQLHIIAATHPSEIVDSVPGAWISRGDGQEHLTAIRSPVFTGAGACGAFVIAEDSIPVRATGFCNVNQLFDTHYEAAESVEVFRGPSSSVFGSNGLFGGINVVSPSQNSKNRVGVELGSHDYKRLNFNALSSSKSLHGYGTVTDTGSFREQAGYKQQKLGFKSYFDIGDWSSESVLRFNNLEQETAGFIEGLDAYEDETLRSQNLNPEAYRDVRSIRASSKWKKLQETSTLVIQPYLRLHRMEFLMHFVPWQPREENQHDSIGLKVFERNQLSHSLSLTKGIEFELTDGKLKEIQDDPAPFAQANFPQGAHYDYEVLSTNISPYFDLEYKASESWLLNAQLRWESVRYDYQNNISAGLACDEEASACRFYRPESRDDAFDSPSGRIGFVGKLNDSLSVFGNIASAYRAPQVAELYRAQNEVTNTLDLVKAEGVDFGVRQQSNRLSHELNIYSMRQKDAIYQNSDRQYLVGADSSHQGLEYSVKLALSENLSLEGVGTYGEHKYENSPDLLDVDIPISGNTMDTAPELSYQASLSWSYIAGSLNLSWTSMGEYYLDIENQHQYSGHDLFDLTWLHRLTDYSDFRFKVNNALDIAYAERADFAFGEYRYFPGAGRTFSFTFNQYF